MRHHFLLDVNVLHHAVKGVDKHDQPDETAAELIRRIVEICHAVTIHHTLFRKYWSDLQKLYLVRSPRLEPLFFVNQVINRSEKRILEYEDLPELPAGVQVPRKDDDIVRAALISRPIVVTADSELRDAIEAHQTLGLKAYSPKEALDFVKQNPPD